MTLSSTSQGVEIVACVTPTADASVGRMGSIGNNAPSRAILRGRLLNVAQLGILSACLWKFLVLGVVMIDVTVAGMACWPDLGLTTTDLTRFAQALSTKSPLPDDLNEKVGSIRDRWDAIAEHFARVRDGHALVVALGLVALLLTLYLGVVLFRAYLYEGMRARVVNADAHARAEQARLLADAHATLPPEFPPIGLRMSRVTFIRHRWAGLTLYLGNFAFALLELKRPREFRFVIAHELFHVRCGDPRIGVVSRALRGLLSFALVVGTFYVIAGWTGDKLKDSPFRDFVQLQLIVPPAILAVYFLRQFEATFLRHKELLADRFAASAYPDVDLSLIFRGVRSQRTHPSAAERIAFLKDGVTDTAAVMFFAVQEWAAFCVAGITGAPIAEAVGPRLLSLEKPALWIAGVSLVILAIEACRTPIPVARREAIVRRGAVSLLVCLIIYGAAHPTWFSLVQLALIVLVIVRLDRRKAPEYAVITAEHPSLQTGASEWSAAPVQPRSKSSSIVLQRTSTVLSWLALAAAAVMFVQVSIAYLVLLSFESDLARVLPHMITIWRQSYFLGVCAVAAVVAVRNLKRPNWLTLGVEWWCYAAMVHTMGMALLWLYDQAHGRTGAELMVAMTQLPWSDRAKMLAAGPQGIPWSRALPVTMIAQLPLAALYAWRVRTAFLNRRREKDSATFE